MSTDTRDHKIIDDVVYLASCAVREAAPDADRVKQMDLDLVFREANRQLLASCCAFALESSNLCTYDFEQAKAIAIRRTIFMDQQRNEVISRLREAGIWHLPLKGVVLKDYYPSIGMREMSDNDILYDATRTEDMRSIMASLGFEAEELDTGAHDSFFKKPLFNFEMHRELFSGNYGANLKSYYASVLDRLLPDEGLQFSYHLSAEDFYLFMVAHEYKHYKSNGVGLRGCFDTYVCLSAMPLDMNYITAEAVKMGIADFERINRSLSMHLICGDEITDEERPILDYMRNSGVYGNVESMVTHRIDTYGGGYKGRLRYAFKRIHMPPSVVKSAYPFFYRHKALLPFLPLVRFYKMVSTSRAKVLAELKSLRNS